MTARRWVGHDDDMLAPRRGGRTRLLATDDASELAPPRFAEGTDVGWAVCELFEAAWIAAGGDPREFHRSARGRDVDRTR